MMTDTSSANPASSATSSASTGVVSAVSTSAMSATKPCPSSSSPPSSISSSPVKHVDPMVRALNTIMYGVLVHFATMSLFLSRNKLTTSAPTTIDEESTNVSSSSATTTTCSTTTASTFAMILLAHEYWVYLQHANVLGNPLCQRLDRQYGIALLKSNQHWAIAGTLAAYWCREALSMFLCLPYIVVGVGEESESSYIISTEYLILYSLIYHTIKSRGVRKDAIRRYSTTYGIMRVVIDKFYHHTYSEQMISLGRLLLQGFDTYIHGRIISDLISSPYITGTSKLDDNGEAYDESVMTKIHILFIVWVFHAACNQWFTCSTATIMVQAWYSLTGSKGKCTRKPTRQQASTTGVAPVTPKLMDISDSESESDVTNSDSLSSSSSTSADDDFVVRNLLRPGRVSNKLKGMQGTVSKGVDNAVKIETMIAIIAAVYIVGFDDVPFRIIHSIDWNSSSLLPFLRNATSEMLSMEHQIDINAFWVNLLYGWLLYSILYAMSIQFLSTPTAFRKQEKPSKDLSGRKRSILHAMDVVMIATGVSHANSESREILLGLFLVMIVTSKSFLRAANWYGPKVFWKTMSYYEILARGLLGRWLIEGQQDHVAFVGSIICIVWVGTTLSNSSSISEVDMDKGESHHKSVAADVVFLGHPAELSDCWALWLLPYPLDERWRRPWWSVPLWPLHYLVGYYTCNFRQKLFGDSASFFKCDDVVYDGLRMQTWTAAHFGRHFVTSKCAVRRNIEAAARNADSTGVKVLCLGALNKAESINGGGLGVVQALGPHRSLSVIHGNHLTAAAVVETTHQCFGEQAKVFLTGASSKVGWAVARALRDRYNYNILCHSTDESRRQLFKQNGFLAASTLHEGTAFSNLWIVGKYDRAVAHYIPQGAIAIVFSVPHPLHNRKDVRVVEAGLLHIDLERLNRPRRFTNKLERHEIFACHAAAVVAASRLRKDNGNDLKRIDEVGPVDPDTMDDWLKEAKKLGFRVPTVLPITAPNHEMCNFANERPPVVIIGAGPAGLATAAALTSRGICAAILEEQTDLDTFGSWTKHFSGLSITTQKRWCNLPGFEMDDHEFPGETVSADAYCRYLAMYAERFNLSIKRGCQVERVIRGGESTPWFAECRDGTRYPAAAVVVATGKHRLPVRDTCDKVGQRMKDCGIDVIHSTDLRDETTWEKAIGAARKGSLCVIGFGNSAADICTSILQSTRDGDCSKGTIHIAVRTVPPVFPRCRGFLRVDTVGSYVRWMPIVLQEWATRLLWWGIPSTAACDGAFPAHLPRWSQLKGRVPIIDKYNQIASALSERRLIGHGPVRNVSEARELSFEDGAGTVGSPVPIDVAIMATGYKKDCIVSREDRLNGIFFVGFGNDKLLPLRSIGEEAVAVANEILERKVDRQR